MYKKKKTGYLFLNKQRVSLATYPGALDEKGYNAIQHYLQRHTLFRCCIASLAVT